MSMTSNFAALTGKTNFDHKLLSISADNSWKKALANSFKSPADLLAYCQLELPSARANSCTDSSPDTSTSPDNNGTGTRILVASSSPAPTSLHAGYQALLNKADYGFNMLVTKEFADLMVKGDPNDPLLLQCLPTAGELLEREDFVAQPLEETSYATPVRNIIHKYQNRLLFLPKGACAINCRYCFRRNFPYAQQVGSRKSDWQPALDYIAQAGVNELIFSGGDPLMMTDDELVFIANSILESNEKFFALYKQVTGSKADLNSFYPHLAQAWPAQYEKFVQEQHQQASSSYCANKAKERGKAPLPINTFRFHSRLPVVLPQRITSSFIQLVQALDAAGIKCVLVLHCNHANEIGPALKQALTKLRSETSITLLNQAVLLKGINDDAYKLKALSESLFAAGVLPYYLHLFDKVKGGLHFYVEDEQALAIYKQLQEITQGYLVPKLAREEPQVPHKTLVNNANLISVKNLS